MLQKLPVNNFNFNYQFNEDFLKSEEVMKDDEVMKDILLKLMFNILKNFIMIYHFYLRG